MYLSTRFTNKLLLFTLKTRQVVVIQNLKVMADSHILIEICTSEIFLQNTPFYSY
jgi:hypothetical protein